jgi:hypothetical protein
MTKKNKTILTISIMLTIALLLIGIKYRQSTKQKSTDVAPKIEQIMPKPDAISDYLPTQQEEQQKYEQYIKEFPVIISSEGDKVVKLNIGDDVRVPPNPNDPVKSTEEIKLSLSKIQYQDKSFLDYYNLLGKNEEEVTRLFPETKEFREHNLSIFRDINKKQLIYPKIFNVDSCFSFALLENKVIYVQFGGYSKNVSKNCNTKLNLNREDRIEFFGRANFEERVNSKIYIVVYDFGINLYKENTEVVSFGMLGDLDRFDTYNTSIDSYTTKDPDPTGYGEEWSAEE